MVSAFCSCAIGDQTCVTLKLGSVQNSDAIPNVKCSVPFTNAGTPCTNNTIGTIDLTPLVGSAGCSAMQFVTGVGTTMFGDVLTLGAAKTAQLKVDAIGAPCSVQLASSGTLSTTFFARIALFEVALLNGKHMMAPIDVEMAYGCTSTFSCTATAGSATSDSVFTCVQ